jgi:hypothetical protein
MNAEQALTVLGERIEWIEADAGEGHQDLKFREARAFFANLVRREALLRNALEHIANTCPGRAAEVAHAGLSAPQEPQS